MSLGVINSLKGPLRFDPKTEQFKKTSAKTPVPVIDTCKRRMRMYDHE